MRLGEQKIRIILADDHPLIRTALRQLLQREPDLEVVGEAGDGSEAVELAQRLKPDLVIMDLSMPVMSGVEATKRIKISNPSTLVLVLTVHTDIETIYSILQAGAIGYLVKSVFGPEVINTIRSVMDGDMVLAPGVSAEIVKHMSLHVENRVEPPEAKPVATLSPKEMEVLGLAARGLSNKEIGARLGTSEATVKSYFVEVFRALNVRSRTEAVFVSLKSGLFTLDDIV